jgi:fructose/tagatose bisphosphate aldolase
MVAQEFESLTSLESAAHGILRIEPDGVEVLDREAVRGEFMDQLVWTAVFGGDDSRDLARWLIRHIANATGAWTASIHDLYMAAGRNEYSNITTPAINLRGMAYDLARTLFQSMKETGSAQVIFELARSEMGYTQQRPAEYASVVLGAAIREGWEGPVFIQGDHYQASLKAYGKDPEDEIAAVRNLTIEAIKAGYGNIDIDASTLVDLDQPTLKEQQAANYRNTADLTLAIREAEPKGLTVSVGGEIGEVGGTNSTVEDLDAFMEGYLEEMDRHRQKTGRELPGISKISVQTGTSHGGIVLPDGSIQEVNVSFDTLRDISAVAKAKYRLGGAVQHGASTLPEDAFQKFAEADAVEVHLATAFMNAIYDAPSFPAELTKRIHAHLDANNADERKDGQTDAQFYYTARKKALGPFKRELWTLDDAVKGEILETLKGKFTSVMHELGVAGQADLVTRYVTREDVPIERGAGVEQLTSVDLGDEGE